MAYRQVKMDRNMLSILVTYISEARLGFDIY